MKALGTDVEGGSLSMTTFWEGGAFLTANCGPIDVVRRAGEPIPAFWPTRGSLADVAATLYATS
jgi:hypothetical protein